MRCGAGDLVRRSFEAYNSRDVDALLAVLHPEVHVRSLMTEAERADYRGHRGVREWYSAVFDVFPDWSPRLDAIREVGEASAVVAFTAFATAAGSGVPIEQRYWQGVHLRERLIDYIGFFRSDQDALEALRRDCRLRV
jgi:ketosteroid isomerase-like protein